MAGPLSARQAESIHADNEYLEYLMPRLRKRPQAMLGALSDVKIGQPWEGHDNKDVYGLFDVLDDSIRILPDMIGKKDWEGRAIYDDIMIHELSHVGRDEAESPMDFLKMLLNDTLIRRPGGTEHDMIALYEGADPEANADHLMSAYWKLAGRKKPLTKESVKKLKDRRAEWEGQAMNEIAKLLKLRE